MKKDVFSVWLKEFCSLVFTQTVQAFLLAIIMSVVIYMADSDNQQQYAGDSVSATSVIAIIALSSISKIELLVKKIFGVESQFGDPAMKNGIKSFGGGIAAGMAVLNLAKRPLDNAKKVYNGVKDIRSSNMDIARLRKRTSRDLLINSEKEYEALNSAKESGKNTDPIPPINDEQGIDSNYRVFPGGTGPRSSSRWQEDEGIRRVYRKSNENGQNDNYEYYEQNFGDESRQGAGKPTVGGPGQNNGLSAGSIGAGPINGISSIDRAQFTGDIRAVDGGLHGNISGNVANIDAPNAKVDGGNDSSKKPSKVSLLDYEEKKNSIMDKYEDALSDAKKKRKKAITQTASGVVETAGAVGGALHGATLKTIIDLAQGDASLSSTIKAGITGAGIGDMIGEKVTTAVAKGIDVGKDVVTGNTRGAKLEKIKNETIQNIAETKHYDVANNNIINNNPSIIKNDIRYERSSDSGSRDVSYRSSIKELGKSQSGRKVINQRTTQSDHSGETNAGNIN